MTGDQPIDLGYLSLPAAVQAEVEAHAGQVRHIDTIGVLAAVDAWKTNPGPDGVNLAAYAAAVLPDLVAERDRLAERLRRSERRADAIDRERCRLIGILDDLHGGAS